MRFINASPAAAPSPPVPQVTYPTARSLRSVADARRSRIVAGAIFLVIGLLISLGTYEAAASNPTGGVYLVAYGPVIFGAYLLLSGLLGRGAPRGRS